MEAEKATEPEIRQPQRISVRGLRLFIASNIIIIAGALFHIIAYCIGIIFAVYDYIYPSEETIWMGFVYLVFIWTGSTILFSIILEISKFILVIGLFLHKRGLKGQNHISIKIPNLFLLLSYISIYGIGGLLLIFGFFGQDVIFHEDWFLFLYLGVLFELIHISIFFYFLTNGFLMKKIGKLRILYIFPIVICAIALILFLIPIPFFFFSDEEAQLGAIGVMIAFYPLFTISMIISSTLNVVLFKVIRRRLMRNSLEKSDREDDASPPSNVKLIARFLERCDEIFFERDSSD